MKPFTTIESHENNVFDLCFSNDGQLLLAGSLDGVGVWESGTWAKVGHLAEPDRAIHVIRSSPDGKRFGVASLNDQFFVYDAATLKLAWSSPGMSKHVSFSSNNRLVAHTKGKKVLISSATTGATKHELEGHSSSVEWVEFAARGNRLASSSGQQVHLWDSGSGEHVGLIQNQCKSVYFIQFSPAKQILATGGADGRIRTYDGKSGRQLGCVDAHSQHVWDGHFSADGDAFVTASSDGTVGVFQSKPLTLLQQIDAKSKASKARVSPDRSLLAVLSEAHVEVWSTSSLESSPNVTIRTTRFHKWAFPNRVAFSPDSQWMAVACEDGKTRIWSTDQVRTGR